MTVEASVSVVAVMIVVGVASTLGTSTDAVVTLTTSPAIAGTERVLTGSRLGFGWSHGTTLRRVDGSVAQSVLQGAVGDDLAAQYSRLLTGEAEPVNGTGALGTPSESPGVTDGDTPRYGADALKRAGTPEVPNHEWTGPAVPQLPPAVATANALDADGTVVGWNALAVTSFDDRGFTLAATSVSSPIRDRVADRPIMCYTTWPLLEERTR